MSPGHLARLARVETRRVQDRRSFEQLVGARTEAVVDLVERLSAARDRLARAKAAGLDATVGQMVVAAYRRIERERSAARAVAGTTVRAASAAAAEIRSVARQEAVALQQAASRWTRGPAAGVLTFEARPGASTATAPRAAERSAN